MNEVFMEEVLIEAKRAFSEGEVPVGAVVVFQNEIVARAHNCVESARDASMHAELLCLKKAAERFGKWRLTEMTLYSTLEPCSMCAGALFAFRIKRLVWGAADLRQGADGSWVSILSTPHPIHALEITRGVLAEQSSYLLRSFFQKRRLENVGANI